MIRPTLAAFVLLAPFAHTLAVAEDTEAVKLAKEITTAGAKLFDAKDAKGLASTYTESGQIILTSKNESGGLKEEVTQGREDVQRFYERLFADSGTIESKNLIDSARLLGTDILLITGTFEVTRDAKTSHFPFVQVRIKQGEKWLMSSVRIFVLPD
jgi:hypothetical protein